MSVIEPRKGVHNLMLARSKTGQRQFIGVFAADRERAPNDGYWKVANTAIEAAETFFSDGATIDADARLSLQGKQEKRAELAGKAIDVIKAQAARMAKVRGMARSQLTELVPFDKYTPGDLIQVTIDIALAGIYRQSTGAERETLTRQVSAGTNPALAAAVFRLPQTISGASENLIAMAARQAIEKRYPVEIEKRAEIESVERTAQAALNQSLKAVVDAIKVSPAQLRELLGPDAEHFDPQLLSRQQFEAHETHEPVNDGKKEPVKPEENPAGDAAAA
jgi:hypothetical protein